ncbi:sugar transferase [Parashewanella tropica]|uniref:sugar transferase n=1 Tax=Parashewanella tropica TaxID=2547970 RepID=UPI00105A7190|nr:sugar transferase [Parashewanella tropica]
MIKRSFDLFFSLLGIIVLSPILLLIYIIIKINSKGPAIFVQKRVGLKGVDIGVYKFRTMVVNAESLGPKITVGVDSRITSVGHFLRRYKLDELAQLFNVLNGSMSFVGPRPEVREYINCYHEDIRDKVLSVRPGITDFASIEFKDENELLSHSNDPQKTYVEDILPIKQKYYLKYIEQKSFLVDLKLILKTIYIIFK